MVVILSEVRLGPEQATELQAQGSIPAIQPASADASAADVSCYVRGASKNFNAIGGLSPTLAHRSIPAKTNNQRLTMVIISRLILSRTARCVVPSDI
jgi:hypothetical protein